MKMRIHASWLAAAAALWLGSASAWAASSSRLVNTAADDVSDDGETVPAGHMQTTPNGSLWDSSGGDCGDDGACGLGNCSDCWWKGPICQRRGVWYAGADYLLVRPHFSAAVAAVTRTLVTNNTTVPPVSRSTDTAQEFNYQYRSAYRAFVGYHLWDCGGDIQFTYWNLGGGANSLFGPADVNGGSLIIAGQLENNTGTQGQFLSASSNVRANIFDLDFAKCLSYGGPNGPCDPCGCPRWDMRWSAGLRVARVTRNNNNVLINADGTTASSGFINADWTGAGARVGAQGRRYFGQSGRVSLYARGNMSLLLGQFRENRTKQTIGSGNTPTVITSQLESFNRMIPVSEIEVGGSWQVCPRVFLSAGWFFQCWWDMGFGEHIDGTNFTALDTANIMAWDGLFVRGEMLF